MFVASDDKDIDTQFESASKEAEEALEMVTCI